MPIGGGNGQSGNDCEGVHKQGRPVAGEKVTFLTPVGEDIHIVVNAGLDAGRHRERGGGRIDTCPVQYNLKQFTRCMHEQNTKVQ